jgi:hypothetical protein
MLFALDIHSSFRRTRRFLRSPSSSKRNVWLSLFDAKSNKYMSRSSDSNGRSHLFALYMAVAMVFSWRQSACRMMFRTQLSHRNEVVADRKNLCTKPTKIARKFLILIDECLSLSRLQSILLAHINPIQPTHSASPTWLFDILGEKRFSLNTAQLLSKSGNSAYKTIVCLASGTIF